DYVDDVEYAGSADGLAVRAFSPAGEVVARAAGEILNRLDAVLAKTHQRRRVDAIDILKGVFDAELAALGVKLGLDPGEIFARAGLQFTRGAFIKAFNTGNFLDVDHR